MAPVLTCLLLAGCGGGEAKQPEIVNPTTPDLTQTAYTELARGLYADNAPGDDGDAVLSQKATDCLAHGLLDTFKLKGLVDIHVLSPGAKYVGRPMAIAAPEAGKWIDEIAKCTDLTDYVFDLVRAGATAVNPDVVAGISRTTWDEARACVHEKVPATQIRNALLQQLTAKPVKGADSASFDTCLAIAYHPKATPTPTKAG